MYLLPKDCRKCAHACTKAQRRGCWRGREQMTCCSPNRHRDGSVHILPLRPRDFCQLGEICPRVCGSDSKRQNNVFENLEQSQSCNRTWPMQNVEQYRRAHGCQAGLQFCAKWDFFLIPRLAKKFANPPERQFGYSVGVLPWPCPQHLPFTLAMGNTFPCLYYFWCAGGMK